MATTVHAEPSFEESEAIQEFWNENYQRLLRAYPEQFVAVDRASGEVVAAEAELETLVTDLEARNLDPVRDVLIEFLTATAGSLIL